MRIDRVQATNILGIKDIDLRVTAPILLAAGHNGAGKSALRDIITMAFTRQSPRGIDQKKDFGVLLNDASLKAGGAVVSCDNDHDKVFSFALPKGKFDGPELSDAMKVALDGSRFLMMTPAERRTFLFALTGLRMNADNVKQRLLAANCDSKKVDEVLPVLRTGFPAAQEYATSAAREAKGAWRGITGATWGSVLAEKWSAPVPEVPAGDVSVLKEQLVALDAEITTQTQALGAIKQAQAQAAADAARRTQLEALAKRVPDLEKLLPAAITERDEYEAKVDGVRAKATGARRVGLVHDMARFIASFDWASDLEEAEASELIAAYTKEYGPPAQEVADPAAVASLPEYERGLAVLKNKVPNLERDLAAARAAKAEYDVLAPAEDALDVTADLAEVNRLLEAAKATRAATVSVLQSIEAAHIKRVEADTKTKAAAANNATVMQWLAIAEQLAPAGIPGQLLKEALAPVNEQLAQAAADAQWPLVEISDDMEVTITREKPLPYQLESKSYQWRANAMIAVVVAIMSGLKVVLLDEGDILEPGARAGLFEWLDILVSAGDIDTAVLAMTLKSPPTNLLDTFQFCWISNGSVAQMETKAVA
jgi:energy-coupling factor transporter ATP-binding protein EcfA2